ncbi:MAG: BACON domain-containing protein [Candidatus Omnitrophota bacterium]
MKQAIFVVLICVVVLSGFVFGAIPAEERAALIALYTSTHGDQWSFNQGWKTPPLDSDGFAMPGTEANWWGVEMSGDHVVTLNLGENNLKGSIPGELGHLSELSKIGFSNNQLSGSIPSELGNLSKLFDLSLDRNQLTGTIPSEIGNLSHLVDLFLYNNQLSGEIPSELGNLTSLWFLNLSHNQLTGSIPSPFYNLTYLLECDLSFNELSGSIPSELGNLRKLEDLYLQHNQFTGSIPSQLGDLEKLEYLYLNDNQLSGGIPSQLGNLDTLKELSLAHNRLNGIPVNLGNLNNLESLDLSANELTGSIPPELGNLSHLEYLVMNENQLSGGIPSEFGNLTHLKYLALGNNQLTGSIPLQLGTLSLLTELNLSDNRLTGSIPSQLGNLNALTTLDLNTNRLSGAIPSEIGNLSHLSKLYLNNNLLSGVIPSSLVNLPVGFYKDLDIWYNCLSATDFELRNWLTINNPGWETHQTQCVNEAAPVIGLSQTALNFGASLSGDMTGAQTVWVTNSGKGVLDWEATSNAAWLSVTPDSGTGNATVSVSVDPTGLAVGNYYGAIIITDPNASNSPQAINVALRVYEQGGTAVPFGEFTTPLVGSTVSNSIAVTGWALDDIGLAGVKIYNGDTYIGDAVFVEGARPDVETAFPSYPNNDKAGWGYMLLTHFLPNGGNGTYTLVAKASDREGNEVTLGSKTITVDNAHAVKPFGAIDTPAQGGTVSGREFVNFGWALTPQPHEIPLDGSTIDVVIDGVVSGHPGYNTLRSDIAALFPGYLNTNGAGGYFYIDTTTLTNGLHTISWNVTDNGGNSDGIGSRYFSVLNTGTTESASGRSQSLGIEKFETLNPEDDHGVRDIEISELERVEIHPFEDVSLSSAIEGYRVVGGRLKALPVGSTFDSDKGIFYWQPGPGFIGDYHFVFIATDDDGRLVKRSIFVHIKPGRN